MSTPSNHTPPSEEKEERCVHCGDTRLEHNDDSREYCTVFRESTPPSRQEWGEIEGKLLKELRKDILFFREYDQEKVIGQMMEAEAEYLIGVFHSLLLSNNQRLVEGIEAMRPSKPYPNASNGYQKELSVEERAVDDALSAVKALIEKKGE